MLKFDLIYENEGILAQAIADLVEGLFIGIGSVSEPFTTDKKFGASTCRNEERWPLGLRPG